MTGACYRAIEHQNLVRFVGACLEVPHVCIASEYCPKGSLSDVLQNDDIPLNWGFRYEYAGASTNEDIPLS